MKLELRSVRIKNCGPIDDIKIDFFDASGKTLPVCVIGGANGSGKTTLLEVIVAMAQMLIPKSPGNDLLEQSPDYLRTKKSDYLQIDWLIGTDEFSLFYGVTPNGEVLSQEHCGWGKGPLPNTLMSKNTELAIEIRQEIALQLGISSKYTSSSSFFTFEDLVPSIIFLPHNRSIEPVTREHQS